MKPPNIPTSLKRAADQQRARATDDRYGQFLQFIEQELTALGRLSPQQISHALNALTDWLGKDDPLGFLHSLQQGQLFNLLGEIAPVVAGWVSDAIGASGAAGRKSRRGGYSRVTAQSATHIPIAQLIGVAQNLAGLVRGGGGGFIDPGPQLNAPLSYTPTPNPVGPSSTIDLGPDSGGNPPNVLEIPSSN